MLKERRFFIKSGDVSASYLRPYQCLISQKDAGEVFLPLSTVDLSFVDNKLPLLKEQKVTLECIVDITNTRVPSGSIQVDPWVLELFEHQQGTAQVILSSKANFVDSTNGSSEPCTIELMILFKYPYRMSFHSSSLSSNKISAVNNQSNLHSHALQLIPKAVYTGHLDIVKAIKRQLRAIFHSMRSIEQGQLLPIELLGEIFVFSVLKIESIGEKPLQQQSVSYQPDQTQIRLTGINDNDDDEVAVKEQEVERLTSSVGAFTLGSFLTDGSSSLSHRLSSMGFAGYDSMMQELLLSLELVLSGDDALSSIGSHGILLYGVSGVGKTLSLQVIAAELGRRKIPFVTLDGVSLQMESEASKLSTSYEFLVQKIETNESFSIGEPNVQGVVLVDNIDAVFLNGNKSGSAEHEDEGDSNGVIPSLASSFMRLIQQFSASKARICIVMTCKQLSSIPEKARRAGCIAKCIEMITPTERMRLEILAFHLALLPLASTSDSSSSASRHHFASRLASLTGGFVAKDLVRICRNALVLACQAAAGDDVDDDDDKAKEVLLIDWHHLLQAQQMIKPSHLTSLNVQSPGSDAFSSPKENDPFAIAGYEDLQRQLLDVITSKFHAIHALALRRMGISSSSGILIYGPSGCGKTRLVKYMASRVQANFVYVKCSELLSKYFGDSEKSLRQLFVRARSAAPCILFFDEFDAIAHRRSFGDANDSAGGGEGGGEDDSNAGGGGGVYGRLLSTFLNEMDGVGGQQQDVLVMAATNRKEVLDPALVRPGRIDKTFELTFPTKKDLEAICKYYMNKMPLGSDVDVKTLVHRFTGIHPLTGADMAAICKDAALRALREDIDAKEIPMRFFIQAWDQRVVGSMKQ